MKYIAILPTVLAFSISYAQSVVPQNLRASLSLQSLGNTLTRVNDIGVYGIPVPPGDIVGDIYLNEDWSSANIILFEQEKLISNVLSRLDVHNQGLEIMVQKERRFIDDRVIRSFALTENNAVRFFINTKEFKSSSIIPDGFFEVIADGRITLLKLNYTKVKLPNYNVALNTGSRDTKIIKDSRYFILDKNIVYELPDNRNKAVEVLQNHGFPESLKARDIREDEQLKEVFVIFNEKKNGY